MNVASTTARHVVTILAVIGPLLVSTFPIAGAHAHARTRFDWPLSPRPTVQRAFDKPTANWLPGHRGVDLAGVDSQSVVAAGSGTVAFAGVVAGKPTVSIDHPGGLRTTYEPVDATVRIGDRVELGGAIGILRSGHDGCTVSACLHWGAKRDRDYLDPLALVRLAPLRLKPVADGSRH
ncbi:murein DD-endopeptidase MepM/ murein hydrolase activator NlpD [Rhodococcus sp. 27YEA15]|uniref:M23 family metallopeptidase n=1 Tax=Rhodococcus sp. 27YEA15 TaxID=3156259 RepID=UPI003C7D2F58